MKRIAIGDLVCPSCGHTVMLSGGDLLCCDIKCNKHYRYINNVPVLIDFDKSILDEKWLFENKGESIVSRNNGLKDFLKKIFVGKAPNTIKNVDRIYRNLSTLENPRILVIGGGTRGQGMDIFFEKYSEAIDSFDIYFSENVNLIADGHKIPLADNLYDLVIVQAVLEHVLSPHEVVNECYRVLKEGGWVYSEIPFMQQVHEGPFDFTRFTESGHRFLFKKFELIDSGFVAGVGSSLLWNLDFFASGVFRSRLVGKAVRLFFFWLKWVDVIVPDRFNIDGACGVFFLGKKRGNSFFDNKQIISHYQGHQKIGGSRDMKINV